MPNYLVEISQTNFLYFHDAAALLGFVRLWQWKCMICRGERLLPTLAFPFLILSNNAAILVLTKLCTSFLSP